MSGFSPNKYLVRVANATILTSAMNDFDALRGLGLFGSKIDQVNYYLANGNKDMWVYRVELNRSIQLATIERV